MRMNRAWLPRGRTIATVVTTAVIVVAAMDSVTYAATGSSLLLGRWNSAFATTTLKNTGDGPVLALRTKLNSTAPFTTNGTGRVHNLNADKLDGWSSGDLLREARTIRFNRKNEMTATVSIGSTTYEHSTYSLPIGTAGFYDVTGLLDFTCESAGPYTITVVATDGTHEKPVLNLPTPACNKVVDLGGARALLAAGDQLVVHVSGANAEWDPFLDFSLVLVREDGI